MPLLSPSLLLLLSPLPPFLLLPHLIDCCLIVVVVAIAVTVAVTIAVTVAVAATVAGQTTAHYVAERLADSAITITRLAQGIPMGGELDYMDDGTLSAALNARLAY